MTSVTVIMPVKNEPYADVMVSKIHKVLKNQQHEVLLQSEEGITNAVWHGLQKAQGEIVAVLDGDGAHDPRYLAPMMQRLNSEVDLVVAYRRWNNFPLHRRILSFVCAWLTRRILGVKLRDPLSAFVVAKKDCFRFQNVEGCKFVLEALSHISPSRVCEFPICFSHPKNKSKLRVWEGVFLLKQLWRLRFGVS